MEKVEKLAAVYSAHVDEMADLITARDGLAREFQQARPGRRSAAQMHLDHGNRRGSSRGPSGARACSARCMCAGPRRRRRRDHAVERAAVPDHAQADPGADRRLHRRGQAGTRNTVGRAVGGRDARGDRPARGCGVDHSRRPRDRRGTGPPSRRRQDLVHRIVGDRPAHRRAVRRTTQAGQPRTRRQVRGDHPRRRRHRPHRQPASRWPA